MGRALTDDLSNVMSEANKFMKIGQNSATLNGHTLKTTGNEYEMDKPILDRKKVGLPTGNDNLTKISIPQ